MKVCRVESKNKNELMVSMTDEEAVVIISAVIIGATRPKELRDAFSTMRHIKTKGVTKEVARMADKSPAGRFVVDACMLIDPRHIGIKEVQ